MDYELTVAIAAMSALLIGTTICLVRLVRSVDQLFDELNK